MRLSQHSFFDGRQPEHSYAFSPSSRYTELESDSPAIQLTATPDVTNQTGFKRQTVILHTSWQPALQPDINNPDEYPSGFRLVSIIIALVLSIFLVSLDLTIVATAIPKITSEFRGLDDVSWYSAAFFMTIGGFQSAWGKAYKYFPLKTTFLMSIFVFELGSLICGVAPNSITLIIGRAIAGIGAAGIGSGVYTIIAFSATPKKRPMFTGIIGASYGIAAVVGPLLGGVFADRISWRWCFYINLPIGGVSAFIILLFFKTPGHARHKSASGREKLLQMDLGGAAIVMVAVVSYILALNYGGLTYAWSSSEVVTLLVSFFVLSIVFVAWEWVQGDRAMISFRLMRNRVYLVSCAFSFFFAGTYFLIIYMLPTYFQAIDGVSPEMSGIRNLPLILSVTVSMLASGAFVTFTGIASPFNVAGSVLALICTALLYTLDIGSGPAKWIGFQIVGGLGWGLATQIPIITVQATAPPEDLPEVTAILLFCQTVGGAIMVSAAQSAFLNVLIKALPETAPGVNPAVIVYTGATDLRKVFPPEQLSGILIAYMRGLKVSFAVAIAATGISLIIVTSFQKWNRLNTSAILGGGMG